MCLFGRANGQQVAGQLFITRGGSQQRSVTAGFANQLQPHRPAAIGVETRRHADGRQAGKGGVQRHFHPAVVGIHRASGHGARPGLFNREGPALRHRQGQHVIAPEQPQQVLVELSAQFTGFHELHELKALAAVVFPQRFGLDVLARVGRAHQAGHRAGRQRTAPDQPGIPHGVEIKTRRGQDSGVKIMKLLKLVFKNTKQLTEDQEEYLKKVMSQLEEGGLPKQTTKMTFKALEDLKNQMVNQLKVLAILQTNIPARLLESHYAEENPRSAGKREVILSMYLAGE